MKNFTLSLYAFHLCHTLTDTPDQVTEGAENLWENLMKLSEECLPFPELKNLRQKLICYQNDTYQPAKEKGRQTEWLTDLGCLDLGSITTEEGFKLQANLQPFRLNDTYAADLTLSPENPTTEIEVKQLQLFKPSCLLPSKIQASIGQTLWIYGETDSNINCQELAEKWANALVARTSLNPVLISNDQNKLLGSLLFEYQATDPDAPKNLTKQCHIFVLINNSQASTIELAGKAYDWLRDFLCCRHKIYSIYQQFCDQLLTARKLYSDLEQDIQNFSKTIANSETRLKNLQELLTKNPEQYLKFTCSLRDLQAHKIAISTNIKNYNTCLKKIKEFGDIPQYWESVLERTYQHWEEQIQLDIDYLSPGQTLFEQMISTVRGIVEIEQAELERTRQAQEKIRDQKLQNTIQAVGAGIGAGVGTAGILATSYPLIEREWKLPSPQYPILPPHPFLLSLVLSLIIGGGVGGIIWWGIKQNLDKKIGEN